MQSPAILPFPIEAVSMVSTQQQDVYSEGDYMSTMSSINSWCSRDHRVWMQL